MNWLVEANACPGLFYGIAAQDGFLIRLRTPGGWLNSPQGKAIATWLEPWQSTIQVTNRANLQIRGLQKSPSLKEFQTLQKLGLAAPNPSIDHLRNIMSSPTAGIDCQELIDTRPLVHELDNFIQNYPSIAQLSPKFSIGIDGGGVVAIGTRSTMAWQHRYNEIHLSAIAVNNRGVAFRLALAGDKQLYETDLLIEPENCLAVVKALVTVYIDYVQQTPNIKGKKPRMKQLLKDWGLAKYLEQVNSQLHRNSTGIIDWQEYQQATDSTQPYFHLGIHPQKQPGLSYIGLSLRLGQLTANQLWGLAALSETFGSGQLRLTPWQTVILPDIPDEKISELLPKLASLGLSASPGWDGGIVACSGKPGCAAAATTTQIHASLLADYLKERLTCNSPVNIHLTGCAKSCAQPGPAEITLLGTNIEQNGQILEAYQVHLGDSQKFLETPIFEGEFAKIPPLIAQILSSQKPKILDK